MPAGLQDVSEAFHHFDVAFVLIGSDAIAAGDADMYHRRAVDSEIEMIAREFQLEKIAEAKLDHRMMPGKILLLKIGRNNLRALLAARRLI
jgi:hypothetical protein